MLRLAFALSAPLAVLACGRAHDLGVETTTGSGGTGGSSTSSSSSSSSSGAGGTATGGAGGSAGGSGPTGPTELTIVNGINDYPAVRFCFLPGDTPWPAATTGLAFAAGQAVDLATAIPSGTDVTPWVVAGDLASTAGMTCTQILAAAAAGSGADAGADAGAPALLAAPLAVLPQSVFSSKESLLLATLGCMGGAGHDDPNEADICGTGYTSATPNPGIALVAMSRVQDPARVSLQVLLASVPAPQSDVQVLPQLANAKPVMIAPGLTLGQIEPFPPFASLSVAGFGALSGAAIETYPSGSSTANSTLPLGPLLMASSVGTAGFVNGARLVLVGVGATPGLQGGSFWHAFTYAVVYADPASP